jgi:hypothetical protein
MIPVEHTPINWMVIIGGTSLALIVIGWFAVHKLAASREKEQRLERLRRVISDFEITISKWVKSIKDTHVPRNQVWTVTLSGGLDLYAAALKDVRTQSIENIESSIRAIRPFLDIAGKARFDKEWKNYQEYHIEGRDEKDPETGQDFTNHTECKNGLIACLEKMEKIVQEIEI